MSRLSERNSSNEVLARLLSACRKLEAEFHSIPLNVWWPRFVRELQSTVKALPREPSRDFAILVCAESLMWLGFPGASVGQELADILDTNLDSANFPIELLSVSAEALKIRPAVAAAQHIDRNYADHITISGLATLTRVSIPILRADFFRQYGCSPQSYLAGVRVARAQVLLHQGVKKEVAARMVGLSRSTLYRMQKKGSGVPAPADSSIALRE